MREKHVMDALPSEGRSVCTRICHAVHQNIAVDKYMLSLSNPDLTTHYLHNQMLSAFEYVSKRSLR
jgi:hypothetical protein